MPICSAPAPPHHNRHRARALVRGGCSKHRRGNQYIRLSHAAFVRKIGESLPELPSFQRTDKLRFLPSIYPSSLRPARNASQTARVACSGASIRTPMRNTCCAQAAGGVIPSARTATTASRLFIRSHSGYNKLCNQHDWRTESLARPQGGLVYALERRQWVDSAIERPLSVT